MHRSRFALPALGAALLALLVSGLITPSAAMAGTGRAAAVTPAAAYGTTVTNFDSGGNQVVRFDTDGNAVDAHDGMIALFGGTYYLYGTAYNCGFTWQASGTPFCGFKVYSSPDLVHWTDLGLLFDPTGSVWQTRCNGATFGCFRPHVVHDAATGMYVLWINTYDNGVDYRVFTSSSPAGPFTEAAVPTLAVNETAPAGGTNNGDETVFTDDDGTAYIVYTDWHTGGGDLVVERLNSSDLSGTGAYTRLGQSGTEAPALFKRNGVYYLAYSDPNCGYCTSTGTSYRTASSPLGPWSASTKITTTSCGGQPSFVSAIPTTTGTAYLYASDLWDGAHNEALANYFWAPLSFGSDGSIAPVTCQDSYPLALATGSAGSQNQPAGVDQQDGVSGFRTFCDLQTGIARFQTFVPSRTGVLSALSYTTFQNGNPNAGLEFDVYQANGSLQPTGTVLSSTVVPASSIGWSPRDVTITPDIAVTAGTRYGFLVKSVATSGCFGMTYNDSSPYPGGGEAYSGNGGSTFSAEAGRSVKFSTSVTANAVPAATPVQLPAGFTWCATENGTCSSSSGTSVIAFGAGQYLYKTVTGSAGCTSSAFVGDPAPGVLKACYIAPSGGPSGYTACAGENGTCSFSGTEMVAYGSNGGFNYQLASSGIACSNSTFGDPMPGVVKSCYLPPAGAPPGSWTQCGGENGTCAVTGTQLIAYGANGAFVYATSNGAIACSHTEFGADPIFGVVKSCYQHGAAPSGFSTQCAGENGTCTFSGTQTVAFGTGGEYVYKTFTGSASCTLAAFGSDPVYGVAKSCYLTP